MPCCQPASDVAENLGSFLVRRNDFELIPTVDMETRNSVKVRPICVVNFQRSVIIVELWRPEVARRIAFFGKTTPYGKIFKILFRKFSSRHRSTCFYIFREIWPARNRLNRSLLT